MKSLHTLSVFALICPLCILIALLMAFIEVSANDSNDIEFLLVFGGIALLSLLQVIYTISTRRFLQLKLYRQEIIALDDFIVQEMDVDSKLVSSNDIMKIFCILCSLGLCLFAVAFSYFLYMEGRGLLRQLTRFNQMQETVVLWMMLFAYLASVPTIIYNIRTLTMKWIMEKAE